MWNMLWPLLLIVGSNCFYHICAKSMPAEVNPFASLTLTYLVGALLSALLFLGSAGFSRLGTELAKTNWTALVLGISIVGLEAGFVFLYRAGWKVSSGALVANICLAVALLFIGWLLYKESISPRQLLGVALCCAGLLLVNW
ncbi:MAG: EamA family transporter [Firmicutes bacterium]|nr:EamA family transporter [Bacillota bacterium]MBR0375660.1 EamA family transporter [Bacillota bacterium]